MNFLSNSKLKLETANKNRKQNTETKTANKSEKQQTDFRKQKTSFGPFLSFFFFFFYFFLASLSFNSFQQSVIRNLTGFFNQNIQNSKQNKSQLLEVQKLTNSNSILKSQQIRCDQAMNCIWMISGSVGTCSNQK